MERDIKRFQDCNWLVKLWRYRHYVYIPFKFAWFKLRYRRYWEVREFNDRTIWSILVGSAQCDMNWVYTNEEVFKNLKDEK